MLPPSVDFADPADGELAEEKREPLESALSLFVCRAAWARALACLKRSEPRVRTTQEICMSFMKPLPTLSCRSLRATCRRAAAVALTLLAGSANAQTPVGTAFTYQGQLKQGGQPYTGPAEVSFELYGSASGGTPIASVPAVSVNLANGLLTKAIDFGPAYDGANKWVEIKVRTGLGGFTTLSPRQQLTAVPYALNSRALYGQISTFLSPHNDATNLAYVTFKNGGGSDIGYIGDGSTSDNNLHLGVYSGDMQFVTGGVRSMAITSAGNVGVGTPTPGARLHVVRGTSDEAVTIQGTATAAANYAYISLRDSAGTRTGYVGDASSGDSDVLLASDAGSAILAAGGNRVLTARSTGFVGVNRATAVTGLDTFAVNATASSNAYGGMYINGTDVGSRPFYGYATNGVARCWTYYNGTDGRWHMYNNGADRLTVQSNGFVGINTAFPGFTFEVNGTAGKPGGGSWSVSSDERLKTNIQTLTGSLETLLKLRGVSFEYKDPEKIHEIAGLRVGLVAQEVEQVIPDWVSAGDDGYKKLTVRGFEAMAVEALRELRDEKDASINALHEEMRELRAGNTALINRLERLERALQGVESK